MIAFVWSPVRFFESRLSRPPRWLLALGVPALCGALDMSAVLILARKNATILDQIFAAGGIAQGSFQAAHLAIILTCAGYPIYFALMAMILASVDVLLRDSGRQTRLAELAGLAFFAFVPSCLVTLAAAMFWTPPSLNAVGNTSFDLQAAVTTYLAAMNADPWLSTAGVIYYVSLAWCVALLGVILKVTSAFSTRIAALASALIFVGFSGILWR